MKASRLFLLASGLLSLAAADSMSGEILGPARGSLPVSQRRLNRVVPFRNLGTTALPMPAEPRKKRRQSAQRV